MAIDVQITANANQASTTIKKFSVDTEKETSRLADRTAARFKNMAVNIAQNFSGSASQIVGGLGRIPGAIGIAAAAVIGLGGAFVTMANKAATATSTASQESMDFLIGVKNLQRSFDDLIVSIGSKLIPVFNDLFESFGLGRDNAQGYLDVLQDIVKASSENLTNLKLTAAIQSDPAVAEGLRQQLDIVNKLIKGGADRQKIEAAIATAQKFQDILTGKLLEDTKKAQKEAADEAQRLYDKVRQDKERLEADVLKGIRDEKEEHRKAIREGLELADRAREKDMQAFDDYRERQRAGLGVQKDSTKEVDKQKDLYRQVGENVQSMVSSFAQAVIFAQDLGSIIKSTIASFIQLAITRTIGLPFGANGLIAMQHGSIVNRPTAALIGEAGPEAVVPLSPNKAKQRAEIMQASGLSGGSMTLNINMPNVRNVDQLAIRNVLLPEINRQIRRGEKLLASKLR